MRTVVSQGCRPIGKPLVVTKAERNIIHELGGKPALVQLREIFDALPTREQRLVQTALHVGRVVSEYQERFEQGDFLVRNVIGIDSSSGAVAIGDYIRPGQTVQFHVRDQEAADAELKQLLAGAATKNPSPHGGLLFTCNGRGTRMFSQPHHDAEAIARSFGPLPIAGLFAAGEIGPIGRQNRPRLHGQRGAVPNKPPESAELKARYENRLTCARFGRRSSGEIRRTYRSRRIGRRNQTRHADARGHDQEEGLRLGYRGWHVRR
jgi:small ligand-binding sensory domain FIST